MRRECFQKPSICASILLVIAILSLLSTTAAKPLPPSRKLSTNSHVREIVGPKLSEESRQKPLPLEKIPLDIERDYESFESDKNESRCSSMLCRLIHAFRTAMSQTDVSTSARTRSENFELEESIEPSMQPSEPTPELLSVMGNNVVTTTPRPSLLPDHYGYDPYGYAGSVSPTPSRGAQPSPSMTNLPASAIDEYVYGTDSQITPSPPSSSISMSEQTSSGSASSPDTSTLTVKASNDGITGNPENPYGYESYGYEGTPSPSASLGSSPSPSATKFPPPEDYQYATGRTIPVTTSVQTRSMSPSPSSTAKAVDASQAPGATPSGFSSQSPKISPSNSPLVDTYPSASPSTTSENVAASTPRAERASVWPTALPTATTEESGYTYDDYSYVRSSPTPSVSVGSSPSASLTPFPSHDGYIYDDNYNYAPTSSVAASISPKSDGNSASSRNDSVDEINSTNNESSSSGGTSNDERNGNNGGETNFNGNQGKEEENSTITPSASSISSETGTEQYGYEASRDSSPIPSPLPTLSPLPSIDPGLYGDYSYDSGIPANQNSPRGDEMMTPSASASFSETASQIPIPSVSPVVAATPSATATSSASISASISVSASPSPSSLPVLTGAREGESCSLLVAGLSVGLPSRSAEDGRCLPGLVCEARVLSRGAVLPGTCRSAGERPICTLSSCTDGGAGAPCEARMEGEQSVATTCGAWGKSEFAPECAAILCGMGCDSRGVVDNLGVSYCNRCLLEMTACVSGFNLYARA